MITISSKPMSPVKHTLVPETYVSCGSYEIPGVSARKSLIFQKMKEENEKKLADRFDPERVDVLRRV